MAAPCRRFSVLIKTFERKQLPLICTSCSRYMSGAQPPEGQVSPPGVIKRFLVDKIVSGVSSRMNRIEKRYPKLFELYRTFRSGSSMFVNETRDYYNVTTALWGGRCLSTFTRHELEVYKLIPQDLFRIAPLLLISVVPGGSAVIALAYLYPKIFLSHHFWTKAQKTQYWNENLTSRLNHAPAVLDWMMRMSLYVEDQPMRNKLVRLIQKLEHTVQPSTEEIMEVMPLFKSFPYKIDRMSITYVRHLALCLNMWPLRAKLHFDGMLLHYTDQAMLSEGIDNMNEGALDKACYLRSLNPFGLTRAEKVAYLTSWTTISQQVDESSVSFLLHCPALLAVAHPNNLHLAGGKHSFWWRKKSGG